MTQFYDEKIRRLPKWAQRYIEKLERDIAALKAERQSVCAGETKVHWDMLHGEKYFIPDSANVTFELNGGDVTCALIQGGLQVYGHQRIVIFPVASNVIRVEARGHTE